MENGDDELGSWGMVDKESESDRQNVRQLFRQLDGNVIRRINSSIQKDSRAEGKSR